MSDQILQEMLEAAVHFGHRTSNWNPKIAPYLHGEHKGVHIFNLEKTAECLEKAKEFTRKLVSEGKTILVVSTKPQTLEIVPRECERLGLPYVVHKWFGGLLTNFSTIKSRIRYLKNMKDQMASGEITKYTKKEQSQIRKEIGKLQNALGGVENMTSTPDALFVTDTVRDATAVKEAIKLGIPVIAFCDSNANPEIIDFPIPGNDDAVKSLTYLLKHFFEAVEKGKKSAPAKKGVQPKTTKPVAKKK